MEIAIGTERHGKRKRGTRTDIYMVIEGREERMRKGKKGREERKG